MRAARLLPLLVAAACARSPVVLPDGGKGYVASCDLGSGWADCYNRAGKTCPNGYIVVEKTADQEAAYGGSAHYYGGGTMTQRSMIYRCK